MTDEEMDAEEPRSDGIEPPSKTKRWPWFVLATLVGLIVLVGWTKTVNSNSFCTRCHSMQDASETASHSVHSDVSCISCHRGEGVRGAIAYVPTLLREGLDQITPLSVAGGVMDPAPCAKCHTTIFTSPLLKGEHPTTGCTTCHGNTSHPPPKASPTPVTNPHPSDWVQLHGREADRDLKSCATCHLLGSENGSGTCMACHFRGEYPHPKDWIQQHGPTQIEQGTDACTLCHASTFCAGCHGTEIPHAADWLGEHARVFSDNFSPTPCFLCHAKTQCEDCHVRHAVHIKQGLYTGWGKNVGA